MDNRDKKIKELEGQVATHTIFIECLIELLYEKEIIDRSTYTSKIEEKIELIRKLSKELKKNEKEDTENPMFYGPHGEA
jgi:hypothetical protein